MNKKTMTEKYKKDLGLRLKEIRKKRGFSSTDISLKLGYAKNTFYGFEKGDREISVAIALKFARLMNVSLDYLFYGKTDNGVFYEWIYKFEHSNVWTIHEHLMTEKQAEELFKKDSTNPEYRKTGREFYL